MASRLPPHLFTSTPAHLHISTPRPQQSPVSLPPPRWRRLQRPAITAATAALLLLDAAVITRLPESAAGRVIAGLVQRRIRSLDQLANHFSAPWLHPNAASTPGLFVARDENDPAALRLIDQDRDSWDELSRLLTSHPRRLAQLFVAHGADRAGFWALTRERATDVVVLSPMEPGAFDDAAITQVRALLRDAGLPVAPAGGQDESRTRILWTGYLHNAAALLALAAFILSLGWLPRLPAACRARRARRRLARGRCPRCRYPLAGLESNQCPECGQQWGNDGAEADP